MRQTTANSADFNAMFNRLMKRKEGVTAASASKPALYLGDTERGRVQTQAGITERHLVGAHKEKLGGRKHASKRTHRNITVRRMIG